MAKRLKPYEDNQAVKAPPKTPTGSGVACTELKCKGEMMWGEPQEEHPQQPALKHATCGKCGWRGWV